MSIIWLSTSFCFYLINILSNTFDDVYQTGVINGSAEMTGYICAALVYEKIGVKASFITAFSISTLGGILILAYGLNHQDGVSFLAFFLFAKFGVTACFTICYAANNFFFPTLFAATAIGFCNFLARIFSSFSFIVEDLDEPTPMIIFTIGCSASAIAAFFLRTQKEQTE